MRLVAVLEVLPRLIRTAGIFLLVRRPADVWLVAAADAAGNAVGAALGAGAVYRMVPFRWAGGRRILDTLRGSWNLFVVRFAASLFAAGNVFVLGVFVPTAVVGYYTGAEKISNAVRMLFNPIYDALYPRVSHLAQRSRRRAFDFTRATLAVMATLALLGSAVIFFGAPWIVRILLGPGFEPAVPVLRIFSLLPPVVVVNLSLGTHGLLVQGRQGLYSGVGLATGVLTVLLTLGGGALLPDYGHWAAAASYIASQLIMAVIFARAMVGIHRRLGEGEVGAGEAS
jgi:PST family polysaccharide transporter